MNRIVGILFSAAVVKIAGAALAIYIGVEVASYVSDVFNTASNAMAVMK